MKKQNNRYWFVLGRERELATAEIAAFFGFGTDSPAVADRREGILAMEADMEPSRAIKKLGGAIKIGVEMATGLSENALVAAIATELHTVEGKIHFGLSWYGNADTGKMKEWGMSIKKTLKSEGLSVRFVFKNEATLSSATVEHNGLAERGREFLILANNGRFDLSRTAVVQPFEDFSKRDFGRPGRDDISGMLPPKLAMMMINLAQIPLEGVLLDPFCGSGTIITEAMLMAYTNLIGTDISAKAVEDTKKNIQWISDNFRVPMANVQLKIEKSDIKNLAKIIPNQSVDAIVTEPFLGRPLTGRERSDEIQKQAAELKKLYLETLTIFAKLLKKGGTAVMIIPAFKSGAGLVKIDLLAEAKKLGFETETFFGKNFLSYSRPDQHVARDIYKFILS